MFFQIRISIDKKKKNKSERNFFKIEKQTRYAHISGNKQIHQFYRNSLKQKKKNNQNTGHEFRTTL